MSDSVDRVFVHALNTVKKIPRTGSARPPPADRLKLYGLYKQSMEGDVDGVMDRPSGDGEEASAEREKWDAWNQQKGLSKTEAKRRYISTLIETMHKYASATPDARELVSELEFVWDQVKSNVSSSSTGSSPSQSHTQNPSNYQSLSAPIRVVSPVSQPHDGGEDDDGDDEFDDARDGRDLEQGVVSSDDRDMKQSSSIERRSEARRNHKWRRRVELALTKMTTEVAALREQIETRRVNEARRQHSFWAWILWVFWKAIKHILFDAVLLGALLIWMRRRRDRGLERALIMVFKVIKENLRRVHR